MIPGNTTVMFNHAVPDTLEYVVIEAQLRQARETLQVVDLEHVLIRQAQRGCLRHNLRGQGSVPRGGGGGENTWRCSWPSSSQHGHMLHTASKSVDRTTPYNLRLTKSVPVTAGPPPKTCTIQSHAIVGLRAYCAPVPHVYHTCTTRVQEEENK